MSIPCSMPWCLLETALETAAKYGPVTASLCPISMPTCSLMLVVQWLHLRRLRSPFVLISVFVLWFLEPHRLKTSPYRFQMTHHHLSEWSLKQTREQGYRADWCPQGTLRPGMKPIALARELPSPAWMMVDMHRMPVTHRLLRHYISLTVMFSHLFAADAIYTEGISGCCRRWHRSSHHVSGVLC